MKTLIDLPEEMLTQVMTLTNSTTKVDAIKKALSMVIEQEKRKKMLNFRGKVDLSIDLDVLRDRKTKF